MPSVLLAAGLLGIYLTGMAAAAAPKNRIFQTASYVHGWILGTLTARMTGLLVQKFLLNGVPLWGILILFYAMCYYNLIPSCKPCNQLKMTNPVAANPYHPSIEKMTYLFPDLPLGINMNGVTESDCKIRINPVGVMVVNESTLALEQRYDKP